MQARVLADNALVLSGQLALLDPAFYQCLHYAHLPALPPSFPPFLAGGGGSGGGGDGAWDVARTFRETFQPRHHDELSPNSSVGNDYLEAALERAMGDLDAHCQRQRPP